jgi:hypothetical protein
MAACVFASPPAAWAIVITDDFSDLNDTANPAWTHMDGTVDSTGRIWDASSGAYFLHTNNDATIPGIVGYGVVGSYVDNAFTDVRVSADFVEVTPAEIENPTPAYFGVAARLHGVNDLNSDGDTLDPAEVNQLPTPENGLSLRGYMYVYEPFARFSNPNGLAGRGEMVLYIFDGEAGSDVRSQIVHLDETKDYRFILEVVGPTLHGQVLNLTDGGVIVAEAFRDLVIETQTTDHDANPSTPDVVHVPYISGHSAVLLAGSSLASGEAQLTVDNFRTETLVAGDYNGNGTVDAADYIVWRNTQGATSPNGNPPTSFGDMRANGAYSVGHPQSIDLADYNFWRSKFGSTGSGSGSGLAGATGVPEPDTVVLMLGGLIACLRCRRRF